MKLDIQGQGGGRILDVDGQGEKGVLTFFVDVIFVSSLVKTTSVSTSGKALIFTTNYICFHNQEDRPSLVKKAALLVIKSVSLVVKLVSTSKNICSY